MNKLTAILAATVLAGGISAMAGQIKLGNGIGGNTQPLLGGGVFNATFQNPTIQGFKTYCLEITEKVKFDYWYNYTINNAAVGGGIDSDVTTPGYDILSKGTAYIFTKYGQGANTEKKANAVQWVIWYLEDEFVYNGTTITAAILDSKTDGLYTQYLNEALAKGGKANIDANSHVKALNLSVSSAGADGLQPRLGLNRQDVLITVPDGGMMLVLLGAGLTAVGVARRRLA